MILFARVGEGDCCRGEYGMVISICCDDQGGEEEDGGGEEEEEIISEWIHFLFWFGLFFFLFW